ncbi:MAG: hypothetical protein QXX88_03370, partial [Metallosphaera sp.]
MNKRLTTGFPEIDRAVQDDEFVEFFSLDWDLLRLLYHRAIALSSPSTVVIVSERGGLDPTLVKRFQRIFGTEGEVSLRRAFKAEDVAPTIKAMVGDELIVIDPYHHRKTSEYQKIVGALRGKKVFMFSYMNREREGSLFGLHSAHSVIKLEKTRTGFVARLVKSVTLDNISVSYGFWSLFG